MGQNDPSSAAFDALISDIDGPLADAIAELNTATSKMPTLEDYHFYTNFPEFQTRVHGLKSRCSELMQQLVRSKWPEDDDEAHNWLVEAQDTRLEFVDAALDEIQRRKRKQKEDEEGKRIPPVAFCEAEGQSGRSRSYQKVKGSQKPVSFHVASLPKPQELFLNPPDNSNSPFVPPKPRTLPEPSHGSGWEVEEGSGKAELASLADHARKLGVLDGPAPPPHPLEAYLASLSWQMRQLAPPDSGPQAPGTLDETKFSFVGSAAELGAMAAKLRGAEEIAVDLEHHSYRSFLGFVCLIQISTRDEDFVVDALALRDKIGPALAPIFENPCIVKVMHGADRDIVWLQRDFGIYVVNLFDTGQASRVLEMESHGLAFLLTHFCQVAADKRFQLADWRIRPLPADMLKYAREDTHYLLFIYDSLRILLSEKDKTNGGSHILEVLNRSKSVCMLNFSKDIFSETSYLKTLMSQMKFLTPEQEAVYAGLYKWRDEIARSEDESTGFVLPNHMLMRLAEAMPAQPQTLKSLLRGNYPLVKKHFSQVLEIIKNSKQNGTGPPFRGTGSQTEGKNGVEEERKAEREGDEEEDKGIRIGESGAATSALPKKTKSVKIGVKPSGLFGAVLGQKRGQEMGPNEPKAAEKSVKIQSASPGSFPGGSEDTAPASEKAESEAPRSQSYSEVNGDEVTANGGSTAGKRDDTGGVTQHSSGEGTVAKVGSGKASGKSGEALPGGRRRLAVVKKLTSGGLGMMLGAQAANEKNSKELWRTQKAIYEDEVEKAEKIKASLSVPFHTTAALIQSNGSQSGPKEVQSTNQSTEGAEEGSLTFPAESWEESGPKNDALGDEVPVSFYKEEAEEEIPLKEKTSEFHDDDDLPLSLSERQRQSWRRKKEEEMKGRMRGTRDGGEEEEKEESPKTAPEKLVKETEGTDVACTRGECASDAKPYDFESARKRLKLDFMEREVRSRGKMEGRKKEEEGKGKKRRKGMEREEKERKVGSHGKRFDPLNVEEESEGIKVGKRSQVFPRSGNRSFTLK